MQFGLIHMFNGKNPNHQISTSAKLYLKRGTKLLENIKQMSSTASRLHGIFKDITEVSALHLDNVDRTLAEEEYHLEENMRRIKERHGMQPERRTMSSIMDAVMLQSPSGFRKENEKSSSTPNEPPTTENFYDATNTTSQPPLNMEAEAFSLTQFGYDTPYDTSSLDYILQNLNALSAFSNDYMQPQQSQAFTSNQNFAPTQVPLEQQLQQEQQQALDTNIFRSDPTNVFWDLPSTMEGLNQWIDTMNHTGWKPFDQNH
jgi:hypothetical protein